MITVLGSTGFIGSYLVKKLQEREIVYYSPARAENLSHKNLGDIIYCIGLTADFRTRPLETVEAHVCKLRNVLQECEFESLTYLSSTRLYKSNGGLAKEDDCLHVEPSNPGDLYNISKALGESLLLASEPRARVARLSSVYGADWHSENFLSTLFRDAVTNGRIVLQTALDSEKDYISVRDAVEMLIKIARGGRERLYNVASGNNVSNFALTKRLSELTGCTIEVAPDAPRHAFPQINVERIRNEFEFEPSSVLDDMEMLVESYKARARESR